MTAIGALAGLDMSPQSEPDPDLDERALLESWYRYQRHEFIRKMRDLTADQLVSWAVPPVELSVLGLVRHMTQMEQNYVIWGLMGGERIETYGTDDYAGGSVETVEADISLYLEVVRAADVVVDEMPNLEATGKGNGRTLRAVLLKMTDEYAIHAGQAHMIRFAALGEIRR